jgi:hypothetical protein
MEIIGQIEQFEHGYLSLGSFNLPHGKERGICWFVSLNAKRRKEAMYDLIPT